MDTRGQAVEIGKIIAAVVAVAAFYVIWAAAFKPLDNETHNMTTNSSATTALDWTTFIGRHFLLIALATFVLGAIATAVFQRRFR